MDRDKRILLGAGVIFVGVAVFLAMTIYHLPYQYGHVESAVLAGAVVLYLVIQGSSEDDLW